MKVFLTLTAFFYSLAMYSFSQGQKPYGEFSSRETVKIKAKILNSARKEFQYGNYAGASDKYAVLLKLDSTNPVYNFEQAQTLFNNFRQPRSIPYYEKAIKYSKDTLGETYYFLASAYHLAGNFDLAQKNYNIYFSLLNTHGTDLMEEEEMALKDEVKRKIEMCDNGRNLFKSPPVDKLTLNGKTHSFRIESVGGGVNGEYDDYGAVLSANDSVMYFTSRKEGNTGGRMDWDDKFFEDIYVSYVGRNGWETAFSMGSPINTRKHEGIISMAADGKTIYFYRGVKQGTFYYSDLVGNAWTSPKVLYKKSDMNTGAWESSFFDFSVIGGTDLYVVSDREGGIGGRDIYFSQKQSDGAWSPLKNLGAPINTKYDEDAPYITPDGRIMYFSSTGHNSIGGFDIFKSEKQGDNWSEPVNLGIPFNTPGNDIYFIVANKSDRAFYSSSSRSSDSTQDMEIYAIDLCDDILETILNGLAKGIPTGTITVTNKITGNSVGAFNIQDHKYSIPLQHGKSYRFLLNVPSIIDPVSMNISIPAMCKVYELYQELEFSWPGLPLVVKNAFFDIKKEAEISGTSNYSELISTLDTSLFLLFSEQSVPTISTIVLAKADTTKTAITSSDIITSATAVSGATTSGTTASGIATGSTTAIYGSAITQTISISNILFDYDKPYIKEEFRQELDKAVDFLKHTNKKAKIEVAGHTDSQGSDDYNLALSKRRGNAVADYLVSKGISKSRIKVVGYGESKPVAANENPDGSDSPEGRNKNRRTEIIVVQ